MVTQSLTIGKVAKAAGIGIETVRFYERKGLIEEPPRTESGYRQYPSETVDRLRFIRRAKDLGFTLGEIGDLLGLQLHGQSNCDQVRAFASDKLSNIEARIADLERIAEVLRSLVASCDRGDSSKDCPILDALSEHSDAK